MTADAAQGTQQTLHSGATTSVGIESALQHNTPSSGLVGYLSAGLATCTHVSSLLPLLLLLLVVLLL
jgi:hypothetical protein